MNFKKLKKKIIQKNIQNLQKDANWEPHIKGMSKIEMHDFIMVSLKSEIEEANKFCKLTPNGKDSYIKKYKTSPLAGLANTAIAALECRKTFMVLNEDDLTGINFSLRMYYAMREPLMISEWIKEK